MPGAGGGGGSRGGTGGCGGGRQDPLRRPAAFPEHGSVPRLAPRPINQRRSELYRQAAAADLYPPVLQPAPTWTQAVPYKVRYGACMFSSQCDIVIVQVLQSDPGWIDLL